MLNISFEYLQIRAELMVMSHATQTETEYVYSFLVQS